MNHNEKADIQFRELEEIELITDEIRDKFDNTCIAVIGMSGGKDSTIAAALCARALGTERVLGVLMPDGDQRDYQDAVKAVECLKIPARVINIGGVTAAMEHALKNAKDPFTHRYCPVHVDNPVDVGINIPPRIRMTTLRAVAASLPQGGRVINTCNYSEDYVGYSTKDGDNTGDIGILREYTAHEVVNIGRALSRLMGIPGYLIEKAPADGLTGKTDEDNFGFTYEQLDNCLLHGINSISSADAETIMLRIADMHKKNLHKLKPMPVIRKQSRFWE